MSVEAAAILHHSLNFDEILEFPTSLDERCPKLLQIARAYNAADDPWQWSRRAGWSPLEHWNREGFVYLRGRSFGLTFGRHALRLDTSCRWSTFLTDPAYRDPLCSGIRDLAHLLGGNRAIYVPDSSYSPAAADDRVIEGMDLNQIAQWLAENCGPPAETFESIYRETPNGWRSDGYFIDQFEASMTR